MDEKEAGAGGEARGRRLQQLCVIVKKTRKEGEDKRPDETRRDETRRDETRRKEKKREESRGLHHSTADHTYIILHHVSDNRSRRQECID